MNKNKKTIRLNESNLHDIIKESVYKVLKEYSHDIDDDNYYGGGLPDNQFNDDDYHDTGRITQKELKQLDTIAETIANIANNSNDDTQLLYQALDCIDDFISKYEKLLIRN